MLFGLCYTYLNCGVLKSSMLHILSCRFKTLVQFTALRNISNLFLQLALKVPGPNSVKQTALWKTIYHVHPLHIFPI